MTNTDIFLEKYKQLEDTVRSTYHLNEKDSISYYLCGQEKYVKYKNEIKYCQEVRNLLSHKSKIYDSFTVEPSQQMILFIEQLIAKILSRAKCCDIQVKMNELFWQPMSGNVKSTTKVMREKLYTHVPILDNGIVVGVFDENAIFNYLVYEEIAAIDENLTFQDIKKYLSIRNREMEDFLFFKATSYVDELEDEFEKAFRKGKRIGLTFITANGRENEKVQGIITPWDIVANKK